MTLIEKIRKFYTSGIIGDSDTNKCAEYLGKIFECDVIILNDKGGFWGVYHLLPIACPTFQGMLDRGMIDVAYMERFNDMKEVSCTRTCFNTQCLLKKKNKCPYKGVISYEFPAIAFDQRIGTVLFIRQKQEFSEMEIALLEMIVVTMAFEGLYWREKENSQRQERKLRIQQFVASLSPAEKQAMDIVIREMVGAREKVIVCSKLAKEHGIGRSVTAAVLRKMEGAGLIETVSMGVAGTYVKLAEGLE